MKESKEEIPVCKEKIIHKDLLEKAKSSLPNEDDLTELSEFFKIFGDKTRIKILWTLLKVKEMCVCDISELLEVSQSAVSHQLRILRQARLVKYRKEGKTVFYSLDDEHIEEILRLGMFHVKE
ncbi:MAG: helix-turn-helix transcriptional regulator [Thermotogae bacterium]|nr:helix-turn-helix transcriptional regulator [Thermotogota bacterium]